MNLEQLHELLDQLDDTIRVVADADREWIETTEAGELCLIIGEVMGWTGSAYYADLPKLIGVRPVTLRKVQKLTGRVTVKESRALAVDCGRI
jgi:hypothetical protein